jgi:hypothetical protein
LQSARLAIQEGRIDNKKKKRKEEKGSDAMGGGRKEEGQMQTQPHRARRQRANSGLRQYSSREGIEVEEERRRKEAKQQQGNASVGSNSWTGAGS